MFLKKTDDKHINSDTMIIGISHGEIQKETIIMYKKLFNKVYFIKEV